MKKQYISLITLIFLSASNLFADPAADTAKVVEEQVKKVAEAELKKHVAAQVLEQLGKGLACIGSVCLEMMNKIPEHFIEHGKGQAAKDQVEMQKGTIEEQKATIKEMRADLKGQQNQLQNNSAAIEQLAENTAQQTAAQQETNSILKRGFDQLTKKETIETAKSVAVIGMSSVVIVKGGYEAYQFGKSIIYGLTEKEQLESLMTSMQLKILKSKMSLNECLVKNSESEKDSEGMPVKCKDSLDAFLQAAGFEQLKKEKEAFLNR